jgi:tetratricopeptide (TPR) repeat protein
MPMKSLRSATLVLASILAFAATANAAEPALRPVPVPDLSKLPPQIVAQLKKERASFDRVVGEMSGDALIETYVMLASKYARAGLYEPAAVALDNVTKLAPRNGGWAYAQGVVAHAQKREADARSYFTKAFAMSPDTLAIRVALANARIEQGDLAGARTLLTEYTARNPHQPVPFALLGDIAMRENDYAAAIDQYGLALKADPKATKLYASLAEAYQRSGNAKAAADARAKAGDHAPALPDPIGVRFAGPAAPAAGEVGNSIEQVVNGAGIALLSRDYDKARRLLDEALRSHPGDAALLGLYARVEAAAGNLAQARKRADAAVAAGPEVALAQANLGIVLEMTNDDAGAQRAYEKALALDPALSEPRIRRGNYFMRAGRYDDATKQYRALVDKDATDTAGWIHLVAAEVAAGRCIDAMKAINGGLAKDSRNGALLQLFVRLASTCPGVGAEERKMALDYAGAMYAQAEAASVGEAFALALAANGRWDDAIKTQQASMFVLVRNLKMDEIGGYREFLTMLQAHKLPDRPWPANHSLFHPQRAAPDPKPVAAPPPR